jgi:hypothetical protein
LNNIVEAAHANTGIVFREHCADCATHGYFICTHKVDERARRRAIRAGVAAQWAVAVRMLYGVDENNEPGVPVVPWSSPFKHAIEALAALPCAVDIVDGTV